MADPSTAVTTKNSSAIIDFQDPLYLHPSDAPNLDLVTEVLQGSENYKVWSREMIVALEAKNKIGFIDGSCKIPKEDYALYPHWKRCNALVKSWIHRSLSRDLIHGVVYCDSAHLIWKDLKERFDRINGARLYALYRKINTISQGANTVTEYYSKLRQLWDEYDSLTPSPANSASNISKEYIDFCSQLKMMQFLMGLNECYGTIRSQILMMSPLPSHNQVYSMVSNEETQKGIGNAKSDTDSSIVFLTNSSQVKAAKASLYCDHCNFTGHTRDTCFKILGYPPNWGRGGRKGSGGRRGAARGSGMASDRRFNANNAASSQGVNMHINTGDRQESQSFTQTQQPNFTKEQYNQILQLLGTGSHDSTQSMNNSNMADANAHHAGNVEWHDQGDW